MTGPSHAIGLKPVVMESIGILEAAFPMTAREEACQIIADCLSVPPAKIRFDMDRMTISEIQQKEILARSHRRSTREPRQYIAGAAWFMGEEFQIGEGVLIPRPDTEILVEESMRIARGMLSCESDIKEEAVSTGDFCFLELCTGSGCIALSFHRKMKELGLDIYGAATDISSKALAYAVENAKKLGCADRIRFTRWDMMTDLSTLRFPEPVPGRFHMIMGNPPYIKTAVIGTLEPEVSLYEPRLALDGGTDGLRFYRRIMTCAEKLLAPAGWILLEIGFDQEREVREMMETTGLFADISVKKDYGGNPRVAIGRKKG